MSADLNTEIRIQGNKDDVLNVLKVLRLYHKGKEKVYIDIVNVSFNNKKYEIREGTKDTELEKITKTNLKTPKSDDVPFMEIEFGGPWGRFETPASSGIFEALADVAGEATFSGQTTGFVTGADVTTKVNYSEHKLKITECYVPNEAYGDNYIECFKNNISASKFARTFKLDKINDEFVYNEFISDFLVEDPLLEYTNFEEFKDFWNLEGAISCKIKDESEFIDCLNKYRELSIPLMDDVREQLAKECTETFTYMPKDK